MLGELKDQKLYVLGSELFASQVLSRITLKRGSSCGISCCSWSWI